MTAGDITPIDPHEFGAFGRVLKQNTGGTYKVLLTDGSGNALFAYGITVPTNGAYGYAIGCLFSHTDGGNGSALYVNEGTASVADFNLITVA